jgi:hypothetical protein
MTPKEKAEELVIKMYQPLPASKEAEKGKEHLYYNQYNAAKKCALIAVEEIILSAPFEPVDTDWDEAGSSAQYWYPQKLEDSAKWWGEVKQEIEKL